MPEENQNREKGKAPVGPDREPEQEPNTHPSTGQHQPDVQDGKVKRKHGNRPQQPGVTEPEEEPGDDPREYNDGEPVEEKSPRVPKAL